MISGGRVCSAGDMVVVCVGCVSTAGDMEVWFVRWEAAVLAHQTEGVVAKPRLHRAEVVLYLGSSRCQLAKAGHRCGRSDAERETAEPANIRRPRSRVKEF